MSSGMSFYKTLLSPFQGDVLWLIATVVLAGAYGWSVGRDRALAILVSLYAALAIVTNSSLVGVVNHWLKITDGPLVKPIWFLAVFLIVYFLFWQSEAFRCLPSGRGGWIEMIGTGILHLGLAICIALILLPEATLKIPDAISVVFKSPVGQAFWLLAPLIFLYFTKDGVSHFDYDEE